MYSYIEIYFVHTPLVFCSSPAVQVTRAVPQKAPVAETPAPEEARTPRSRFFWMGKTSEKWKIMGKPMKNGRFNGNTYRNIMGISAEKLKWENTVDAAGEPECSHVKHVCETSY